MLPRAQAISAPVYSPMPLKKRIHNKPLSISGVIEMQHRLYYEIHIDCNIDSEWCNAITGKQYWLLRSRCTSMTACMKEIAMQLDVPQRCIVAIVHSPQSSDAPPTAPMFHCENSPAPFRIVLFQGCMMPGCFPVNSKMWDEHCNICDDKGVLFTECSTCGVHCCKNCLWSSLVEFTVVERCWLCRSGEEDYIAANARQELLNEAYDSDRFLEGHQGFDSSQWDFFPFTGITGTYDI